MDKCTLTSVPIFSDLSVSKIIQYKFGRKLKIFTVDVVSIFDGVGLITGRLC